MNTAAGHNYHISALANIEIIVNRFCQAAFTQYHWNMHAFIDRAGFDVHVNAGLVLLRGNLNMLRGLAAVAAGVLADVEGPHGLANEVRDLFQ